MVDFVRDAVEVERFAQRCLSDASEEHPYLVSLAYRRKYDTGTPKKGAWFKTRLVTDGTAFLDTVERYSSPKGYTDRKTGEPYPANALVLYVTIERADRRLATKTLVKRLIDDDFSANIDAIYTSCLSRHREKRYIHLDVDDKSVYAGLETFLDENEYPVRFVIETRNGYHVVLSNELSKDACRKLYGKVHSYGGKTENIVSYTQGAVPIPGTDQNGFVVRMVR